MSIELRWAVTDGPSGLTMVTLPQDPEEARRLDRHYGGAFWCSTAAGGCGGRLGVDAEGAAGPCFRHDADTRCAFLAAEADAGIAYEPVRYQRGLVTWLEGQGYHPRVERALGRDGRRGLHVVVPEVNSAIEVQLGPLPDIAWRERDDRIRTRVRRVTWLYGPDAEAPAATEAAVRGMALAVRRHGAGLAVGVRDVDGDTRWVRLAACRLAGGGFTGPGVEEARALHVRRVAGREEAARRAARETARRAAGRTPAGDRASTRIPGSRTLRPLPFAG